MFLRYSYYCSNRSRRSIIGDTTTCDGFHYSSNYLPLPGGNWFYYSDDGNLTFDPNNSIANPTITVSNSGIYYMGLHDIYCNDTLLHTINSKLYLNLMILV